MTKKERIFFIPTKYIRGCGGRKKCAKPQPCISKTDASNIACVIELLQQYLQVKSIFIRDVKVDLNVLLSVTLYERVRK